MDLLVQLNGLRWVEFCVSMFSIFQQQNIHDAKM